MSHHHVGGLTNRWSGRVRDKVPSSNAACAPLSSTVRRHVGDQRASHQRVRAVFNLEDGRKWPLRAHCPAAP